MNKKFFISLFCVLLINFELLSSAKFAKYKKIDCKLKPLATRLIKKSTHPLISIPNKRSIQPVVSTNWSGYVAADNITAPTQNSVSKVVGSWNIPKILPAAQNTYLSIWVGIDGYPSNSVEQIGTAHDWVNGAQANYAWFEMYPLPPYEISGFPLNIGDTISGSVEYIGNNIFLMKLANDTQKIYTEVDTNYTQSTTAQRVCAEWIVEAPYSDGILPLSNFGTIMLFQCSATINNITNSILSDAWQNAPVQMWLTQQGDLKALPMPLKNNGRRFNVNWRHE